MVRKIHFLIALALVASLLIGGSDALAQAGKAKAKFNQKTVELQLALRDLWIGHIFWVRNVVLTTKYGDATAAKVAEDQVVANAKSIAASITPFYGKDASDKLFGLLAGHWGAVKEYMNAAYTGDNAAKDAAVKKLNANADEIAGFLSSANPNWPKNTLAAALQAHVGHHIQQIDAINGKDFTAEAKTWTMMKDHMYVIADVLANGIVKQFPKKF
jgi:hypothetical protein